MAGARPSGFKRGGGGFLNNVDGVIRSYLFTDEYNGEPFKPGKWSDGSPKVRPIYALLTARADDAVEDVTTNLKVGRYDDFEISEDGKTLTPVGDAGINGNSQWGIFVDSLVAAGFPEERLPEDEINYEPIEGTRVRFMKRRNDEMTKKYGKRRAKDGSKEYDRDNLVIETVYALPGTATAKAMAKAARSTGKAASAKANGKANGQTAAAGDSDIDELVVSTLLDILQKSKATPEKPLAKSKLSVRVYEALGREHPQRQDVYKRMADEDFLTREMGWSYDQAKQELAVA